MEKQIEMNTTPELTALVKTAENERKVTNVDQVVGTLRSFGFQQGHGFGSLTVVVMEKGRRVLGYADYKIDPHHSPQRAQEESNRLFESFSGEVTLKGSYEGLVFMMKSFKAGDYEVRF